MIKILHLIQNLTKQRARTYVYDVFIVEAQAEVEAVKISFAVVLKTAEAVFPQPAKTSATLIEE